MKQPDFIRQVAQLSGTTQDRTEAVLEALGDMLGELGPKEHLSHTAIGKFELVERKASQGRNPRTGEKIAIAAKRIIKYTAAKRLRDQHNPAPQEVAPRRRA